MKRKLLLFRHRFASLGILLSLSLFVWVSATAQNLLKNGDFEQPVGPTNWNVLPLFGSLDDFEIKDRVRGGSMYPQGSSTKFFGGMLRPLTLRIAHSCFAQTVTNLTKGQVYQLQGHMQEDWWKSPTDALRNKYLVYMEAIGGQGTPLPDGRFSMLATNDFTNASGNPDANIDAPYTFPTIIWRPFFAQQIPDTNGNIEVRLHYKKTEGAIYDKTWTSAASFDDVSLTLVP